MQISSSHIWAKITLLLVPMFCSGCSASKETEETVSVRGSDHAYSIPAKYAKQPNSAMHIDLGGGDESASTALLISETKGLESEFNADFLIYVLLFHDKKYQQEKLLLDAARSILERSFRVGADDGLYHYQEELDENITDYYFSFDPSSTVTTTMNGSHFYARIQKNLGLDIEGIVTVAKPSCRILSVYDGILVQTTVVDDVCVPSNLVKLKVLQDNLMVSWRSEL